MSAHFCDHLADYRVQYVQTEAAYHLCVSLLEKVIAGGPDSGLADLVDAALADWAEQDKKLRDMLVEEVQSGGVRVPQSLIRAQRRRAHSGSRKPHHPGRMVCAACRRIVPRLSYPEWQIAHNGVIAFRGEELTVPVTV